MRMQQEEGLVTKTPPKVAVAVVAAAAAGGRKERSVLQAKLTKLAIQIGYAGCASARFVLSLCTQQMPVWCLANLLLADALSGAISFDTLLLAHAPNDTLYSFLLLVYIIFF